MKIKRIICLLLALAMLLSVMSITTYAADTDNSETKATYYYEASSMYDLKMYLTAAGDCTIKLTDNIKVEYEPETEGHSTINVYGNKTIDLNGYKIECIDASGIIFDGGNSVSTESEKTLFHVYKVSTLTVNDSKGGGEIAFKGEHLKESEHYFHYAKRDVFSVDGTLIINAGKITAGSNGKEYIYKGEEIPSVWGSLYSDWSGYAQQVTWGTVAHVNNGGKLVVNGGELSGRGVHIYQSEDYKAVVGERDEVVYVAKGGTASINGGSVVALEGANVFAGDGVEKGLKVRIGKFELKDPSSVRVIYDKELYANEYKNWGLSELVAFPAVGSFNIPENAYYDVYNILSVKYDGKTYKGFSEISALDFEKDNYKNSLSLEFAPVDDSNIYDAELQLVYGTDVYDNAPTHYEYYVGTADNLKLYCNFEEPYFVDYNSETAYIWSIWVNDNEGKADYEFFTNDNYINPVVLSQADLTGKTVFVSCDACELGPNNSAANHYTNTFKLSPVNKPIGYLEITEEQPAMPVGENTGYVESNLFSWDGFNFNHKPLPQELINAGYYVERVYSLEGPSGTEIPEKSDRGTNRIEFGTMYSEPGIYTLRMGLRLKDKDGNTVDSLVHVFYIFVNNYSEIFELSAEVPEPVAGNYPNEDVVPDGYGYLTTDVDWSYYNEQDDEYYIMPEGMTFEVGKTYECAVQFEAKDGYRFTEDRADASGFINEIEGDVSVNYSTTRAYVTVKFTVSEKENLEIIFTKDSKPETGSKLTVDIDAMVELSDEFMEAYFEDEVSFQWYLNGSKMHGFTDSSIDLLSEYAGNSIYVEITYGDNWLESDNLVIAKGTLLGDVDGDGDITIMDATAIQRHIAQLSNLKADALGRADVDNDSEVTVMDATIIQRFVAQIIDKF